MVSKIQLLQPACSSVYFNDMECEVFEPGIQSLAVCLWTSHCNFTCLSETCPTFPKQANRPNRSLIPHKVIVKIKRNNKSSSVVDNMLSTLHTLSHSILTNLRKLRKWLLPFHRWENSGSVICAESLDHCLVLYLALEVEVLNRQREKNIASCVTLGKAFAAFGLGFSFCKMREMFGWWVRIFEVPVLWGALNISVKVDFWNSLKSPMPSVVHSLGINVYFCLF